MRVPHIIDNHSIAITIHEYIHLLKMFDYIGKEYVFSDYEDLLPTFYELVFAKENNDIDYSAGIPKSNAWSEEELKYYFENYFSKQVINIPIKEDAVIYINKLI